LSELEPVYLWVDGIYVKAGLEKEKAAMLRLWPSCGVVRANSRAAAGIEGQLVGDFTGSAAAWIAPSTAGGGRWASGDLGCAGVYPQAAEQQCWNHRILNVLDKLPRRKMLGAAKLLLTRIP
jgi:putative transposase